MPRPTRKRPAVSIEEPAPSSTSGGHRRPGAAPDAAAGPEQPPRGVTLRPEEQVRIAEAARDAEAPVCAFLFGGARSKPENFDAHVAALARRWPGSPVHVLCPETVLGFNGFWAEPAPKAI